MPDVLIALIIGATIAFSMYAMSAAYRSSKGSRARDSSDESRHQIAALREELEGMRREVGELAERLDFAERLLAKPRDALSD